MIIICKSEPIFFSNTNHLYIEIEHFFYVCRQRKRRMIRSVHEVNSIDLSLTTAISLINTAAMTQSIRQSAVTNAYTLD